MRGFSSWLRRRFAPRRDLGLALVVWGLPVHAWTWVLFFYKVPSYLLKLSLNQTLGVFAYAQAFALLESVLFCSLTTLIAFCLPRRLFINCFVPQTVLLVLAFTAWTLGIHQQQVDFTGPEIISAAIRPFMYAWTFGWLLALLALSAVVHYWTPMKRFLLAFADRLIVLSSFFLLVDVICVTAVVLRNL